MLGGIYGRQSFYHNHNAQGSPSTAGKCLQAKIGKISDKEGNHSLLRSNSWQFPGTCVLPRAAGNVAMNPGWKALGGDVLTHGTLHKSEIFIRITGSIRLGKASEVSESNP